MTVKYNDILDNAKQAAKQLGHQYVTSDHVFFELLKIQTVQELIDSVSSQGNYVNVANELNMMFGNTGYYPTANNITTTASFENIVGAMNRVETQHRQVTGASELPHQELTLLTEVLRDDQSGAVISLENNDVDIDSLLEALSTKLSSSGDDLEENALEKYSVELVQRAKDGKLNPMVGREEEVQTLVEVLARKNKCNAVLTGMAGVGKTAIIEGVAQMIADGTAPETLKDCKIRSVDVTAMIAGAKYRGDFEKRLLSVLEEVSDKPDEILFIDEIHTIMGTGTGSSGSALDMANIMKPKLSRGEIRVIGSTTEEEFKKHFEKDKAMIRRFMRVDIKEPTLDVTKKILRGIKETYEKFHNVTYSNDALDRAVELSARYIQNCALPDKAIDIIDAAGAKNKVSAHSQKTITVRLIEQEIAARSGIPVSAFNKDEGEKFVDLASHIKKKVFGQDKAVETLATAVMVSSAGLNGEASTMGNFILTGPTGTGKTEVCKVLSNIMNIPLVRYDMSEYMEKHSVAKMLGAPPGYVGYEEGGEGKLVNDIEKNPNCILLLDEIEKAHRDVLNTFLQVMDDGHITGNKGKVVSFKNVILVMTTNLGAAQANKKASIGAGSADGMDKAIEEGLTPEFRNRVTEIIKFNQLNEECMLKVVDKMLAEINASAAESNVKVVLDDSAKKFVSDESLKLKMGGRPVKRILHKHVKVKMAPEMLSGKLKKGGTITFSENNGELTYKVS